MTFTDGMRYRAVRHYKDARHPSFDEDQDAQVNGFLQHLQEHDPAAFDALTRKLVHQVVLDSWDHVAKVLKAFKLKRNAGYHLEVEEFSGTVWPRKNAVTKYRVKVFKELD